MREYKRGLDSLTVSLLFTRQSRGDENIAASAISSGGVFTSLTTQTVNRNKQLHNDNLNSLCTHLTNSGSIELNRKACKKEQNSMNYYSLDGISRVLPLPLNEVTGDCNKSYYLQHSIRIQVLWVVSLCP